jgi:hypothetical protein
MVFTGVLAPAWNAEMQKIASENFVARLWARDTSLWPAEHHQIPVIESNRRWLDLPSRSRSISITPVNALRLHNRMDWITWFSYRWAAPTWRLPRA